MDELLEDPPAARRTDRRRPGHDKPRKASFLILVVALLVLVGGMVAASSYYEGCKRPPIGPAKDVSFDVPPGASAQRVMSDLADAGIVKCSGFVGSLLMRGTGKSSDIRAGSYQLTTGMTLDQVMTVLTTPPKVVPTTSVLIPPGYRLTQIAETLQARLGIPQKAFLSAAQSGDYSLDPYLPKGTPTVEGFIWPETTRFPTKGTTAGDVIDISLQQFDTAVKDLPWDRAEKLRVTPYQVMVIASMIEKEAGTDRERPLISAVIYNRLRLKMALGIDATVGYIDPDPSDGLTSSDLAIDSPYNTRLNPGLPPTPIASPGLASIKAALDPANVGYLYYVACAGGQRFSVDYETFLRNKAECLG